MAASDGTKLSYKYYENETNNNIILYFGGNAYTAANMGQHINNIGNALNSKVYMFDPPGYGRSESSIRNEQHFYTSVEILQPH